MHSPCRSFAEEESGGNSDHNGGHPHGTADACTEGTGTSHILLKPANGKLKQPLANPPNHVAPINLRNVPDLTACRDINATMCMHVHAIQKVTLACQQQRCDINAINCMQYRRSPWPVSSNDVDDMTCSLQTTVVSSGHGAWVQVRQLQPQAVASWWQPGHPGWAIYPVDSEQFMSTGALDNVSVPNDSTLVVPPPPDSPGDCAGSFDLGVIALAAHCSDDGSKLSSLAWCVCQISTAGPHAHCLHIACSCSHMTLYPSSVQDTNYKPSLP